MGNLWIMSRVELYTVIIDIYKRLTRLEYLYFIDLISAVEYAIFL